MEQIKCGSPLTEQFEFSKPECGIPYIVGLVSYDDYDSSLDEKALGKKNRSRVFWVKSGFRLTEGAGGVQSWEPIGLSPPCRELQDYGMSQFKNDHKLSASPLTLKPAISDQAYLRLARRVLESIRNGEYYQLNLLRYFEVFGVEKSSLLQLFASRAGPMSCWVKTADVEIFSLSPEKMIEIYNENQNNVLRCFPIKGTAPRGKSPEEDLRLSNNLLVSLKNRAELAMIVDLMRNDFQKICKSGSVRADQTTLQTYSNVHHLVGQVQGYLRQNISYGEVFQSLFPAGSITGAPKIAVMNAIRKLEKRRRGYFMGHAFILEPNGRFNCSILIRTMARSTQSEANGWEFAAGSGIVIKSSPEEELEEIGVKSRIIL